MASLKSLRSRVVRVLADAGIGLSVFLGAALIVALLGGALYGLTNGPTWARLAIGIPIVLTLLAVAGRSYRNGGF